jgi:hypothetical protein
MQHQVGKHSTLTNAADGNPSAAVLKVERAENLYAHRPPPPGASADCQNVMSIVEAHSTEDKHLIWDEKERHTRA